MQEARLAKILFSDLFVYLQSHPINAYSSCYRSVVTGKGFVFMLCKICTQQPAKYKCTKCYIEYCSVACFKQHKPVHEGEREGESEREREGESEREREAVQKKETVQNQQPPADSKSSNKDIFQSIIDDSLMQQYLRQTPLQINLSILVKLYQSVSDGEYLVNLKLMDLRKNGVEENELIEEFIQVFLALYEKYTEND